MTPRRAGGAPGEFAKTGAMLPRLNRLFAADGRCFDVAVDHGFFNEAAFLAGIEDIAAAVRTLVDAAPDAIQLSPGQALHSRTRILPRPRNDWRVGDKCKKPRIGGRGFFVPPSRGC